MVVRYRHSHAIGSQLCLFRIIPIGSVCSHLEVCSSSHILLDINVCTKCAGGLQMMISKGIIRLRFICRQLSRIIHFQGQIILYVFQFILGIQYRDGNILIRHGQISSDHACNSHLLNWDIISRAVYSRNLHLISCLSSHIYPKLIILVCACPYLIFRQCRIGHVDNRRCVVCPVVAVLLHHVCNVHGIHIITAVIKDNGDDHILIVHDIVIASCSIA